MELRIVEKPALQRNRSAAAAYHNSFCPDPAAAGVFRTGRIRNLL